MYQIAIIENKACKQEDMTFISTKAREELHKLNDESTIGVQNLILKFNHYTLGYLSLAGEFYEAPIFNWMFIYCIRVE